MTLGAIAVRFTFLASVFFNEIMPANIDMNLDPSFNYGAWVEIANSASASVNLKGCFLSTDPEQPEMYRLEEGDLSVPGKGYKVLWFGHHSQYAKSQIDMKMDCDGGWLGLFDADGQLVTEVDYPEAVARASWARMSDGSWQYNASPSPGKGNSSLHFGSERLEAPVPSEDAGFFTDQVKFTVPIPEGVKLMYTKDGSSPAGSAGKRSYTGEFSAKETTVFRFCYMQDGKLTSPVVTRSFIKKDYDFKAPVVSIATAPDNLYSTEYGLFMKGPNGIDGNGQTDKCNWNMDWDRPVNFEMLSDKGEVIVDQEVDLCPTGRYSRAYTPHPFKLKAGKKYEFRKSYQAVFFPHKQHVKYRTVKMRNGGNENTTRFRDAALQQIVLQSGLDLDCLDWQIVHHYINGKYLGTINLREPSNEAFVYANYGYDEDEIDMFKIDHKAGNGGYINMAGSRESFDRWNELSASAIRESSYEEICRLVDVGEFCNYMAVELFLGNWDWPRNNIKAWRPATEDGRYRFILFDLDYAVSNLQTGNPFEAFEDESRSVLVPMFRNMLKNKTFQKLFIDSFCIVAESVFDPARCKEIITSLSLWAGREMAFYGDSPSSIADELKSKLTKTYRDNMIDWLKEQFSITYSKTIITSISSDLSEARISYNGLDIPTGSMSGTMFLPITLEAEAPAGYAFAGWMDAKEDTLLCSTPEYSLNRKAVKQIQARFVPAETPDIPVRINEVCASGGVYVNEWFGRSDWLELYNTTSEPVSINGMYLSNDPSNPELYKIEADAQIPANGHLIIWCDKLDGEDVHAPFKLSASGGSLVLTAADGSWSDTFNWCSHAGAQSVGLYPDGGTRTYVMNRPSIGLSNLHTPGDVLHDQNVPASVSIPLSFSKPGDDAWYDLSGRRIARPVRGSIYIRGGKKQIFR